MKISSLTTKIVCPNCLNIHETTVQTLFDITSDGTYTGLTRCGSVFMVRFAIENGVCKYAVATGEPVFIPLEQQVYVFTEYLRERVAEKMGISKEMITDSGSKCYCVFPRQVMASLISHRFPKLTQREISAAIGGPMRQRTISYAIKTINTMLSTPSSKWRQKIYNELKEELFHETTA